jgi:site-specific recombinase XerD
MLCCSKTNRLLKRIAAECSIDRRVTFHMARHCYASQVCLSQGIPLETVGELLGHRDWRATRIYAQVSREKIGEDMRRLDKRLSGGFRWADGDAEGTLPVIMKGGCDESR